LGNENIPNLKELWFEKDEIKNDDNYYNIIISLVNIFTKYCDNVQSFIPPQMTQEINKLFKASVFLNYYENMVKISKMFDLEEDNFSEISCALYCLGFKKSSPINKILISILKEFVEELSVIDSSYTSRLKAINIEIIDEVFMNRLTDLFELILRKEKKEIIESLMNYFENPENSKIQRTNTISTEVDENHNNCNNSSFPSREISKVELQNTNIKKIRKESNSSQVSEKSEGVYPKNFCENSQIIKIVETLNEKPKEEKDKIKNPEEIAKKLSLGNEKERPETQKEKGKETTGIQESTKEEETTETEKEKETSGRSASKNKKDISKTQQKKKEEIQEENTLKTIKSCHNNKTESETTNLNENNIMEKNGNNDLDVSFENIKKNFHDPEQKKEEKPITSFEVLSLIQRNNRYYDIVRCINEFKETLEKFRRFQNYQKEIYEDKIEIQKCLVMISEMNTIIELLKPATIVNIKRKIIDMMIFTLLKNNIDKFSLKDGYTPQKNFLTAVQTMLQDAKKKCISKEKENKINEKIEFINNLIEENKTTITGFPFDCNDSNLSNIIKYLSFFKKKLNKIVHISKEAMKYYYFPFTNETNQKIKDLFGILNDNKIVHDSKISKDNEKVELEGDEESDYKKVIEIDIDTAIKFLLSENFRNEVTVSELTKKLDEINSKKNLYIVKYSDSVIDGLEKIISFIDKSNNRTAKSNLLHNFSSKEKEWILNEIEKFQRLLDSLKKYLLNLNESDEKIELLDLFFDQFYHLVEKELEFDQDYYGALCEKEDGRYLLIFFQYKFQKYKLANKYSLDFFRIMKEFFENKKKIIISSLLDLKKKAKDLKEKIVKMMRIKSAMSIFIEWKFCYGKYLKDDFNSFVDGIKTYSKNFNLKLNQELISDQTTSLWLIKNKLDEFLD